MTGIRDRANFQGSEICHFFINPNDICRILFHGKLEHVILSRSVGNEEIYVRSKVKKRDFHSRPKGQDQVFQEFPTAGASSIEELGDLLVIDLVRDVHAL